MSSTNGLREALSPEQCRLQALRALRLLDSEPEEVFDRVVRIAACMLNVPIALFSLVDECRQWFKAQSGTDLKETPRDISFCTITIEQPELLLVEDATRDERFAQSPLVTGESHIRFYLGFPIRTTSGHAIGTLCCIDTEPRSATPNQIKALQELAALVSDEIAIRERMHRTLEHVERVKVSYKLNETKYRAVFELANIGIALVDIKGRFTQTNPGFSEIVGYSSDELTSFHFQDITHPEDLPKDLGHLQKLLAGEVSRYQIRKRYRHKLGHDVWINLHVSAHRGETGVDYFVTIIEDVDAQIRAQTQLAAFQKKLESGIAERTRDLENTNRELRLAIERQLRAEQTLRVREAELSNVIEYANDAYVSIDIDGVVRAWNRKSEETFQWTAAEAIGQYLDNLIIPQQYRGVHRAGLAHLAGTGSSRVLRQRLELPAIRKDGSTLVVEVRVHAIESDGQCFFSAFLHDITDRILEEQSKEYDLRHDYLTGLPNRRAFQEALSSALTHARGNDSFVALLFIDLDGFKSINDSQGHEAGDELLRIVAERMRRSLASQDQVFRLAGDEFTVLILGSSTSFASVYQKADKILTALAVPVELTAASVAVSASIGVAIDFGGKTTERELIRQADAWMYEAKRSGRGVVLPAPEFPRN